MKHLRKYNEEVPEVKLYTKEEVKAILKLCNKDLRLLSLDKILDWFDKNIK